MAYLMPLIQQMLISVIAGNRSSPRIPTTEVGLAALAVILIGASLVFSLYAECLWLGNSFLPEMASLVTAGTALILALVSILAAKYMRKQKRKNAPATPSSDLTETISHLMESLGEELEGPIRDHPKTAVLIASLAGFMAGEHRLSL